MGTRRRNPDDGGSLDSLLDTLTNVVGILVILLALARLDVSTQVRAIQGIDAAATPQAVAALTKRASEVRDRKAQADQQAEMADPAKLEARIEELLAEAERIRAELAKPVEPIKNPDEIQKQVDEVERQVKETEARLAEEETSVSEKRARLEDIRPAKEPPAKVVRLPNPRAPADGLKPVLFVCKNERVAMIDTDSATDYAVRILKEKAQTKPDRCDCEKAVALFEREKYGNEEFRLRLTVADQTPHLLIEHIAGKGTTARQADRSTSPFAKALSQINPGKQYARFLVWPDSYEVYLAARAECDKRNIPAGWQPFDEKAEWQISLGPHFRCDGWVEPPAAPPQPPPNPAPGPAKPTPVDTVD